jgi:hypothetical protein
MARIVGIATLALTAGAACIFSALASAATPQRPTAVAPPGWSSRASETGGTLYFVPPGAANMDVYEAIFPTQLLNGSLEETATGIWRTAIGAERVVDSQGKRIRVSDGAPAYEVLVATLNTRNEGVYRVFVVKQFGQNVAAGELRFNDVDRIKAIGKPAVASLENMST